ncbi:hypothetical protein BC828DRAFT_384585 [Blastocladiella britannica]|nr:hypothetical protein BC828DRAFT_384585 [Blastocladiella britannica]
MTIPDAWRALPTASLATVPSSLATAHARTRLDAQLLYAQHADRLAPLASAHASARADQTRLALTASSIAADLRAAFTVPTNFPSQETGDGTLVRKSILSSCTSVSSYQSQTGLSRTPAAGSATSLVAPQNDIGENGTDVVNASPVAQALADVAAVEHRLAAVAAVRAGEPDLAVLMGVPAVLDAAVAAIGSAAVQGTAGTGTMSLPALLDGVFALVTQVAALARRERAASPTLDAVAAHTARVARGPLHASLLAHLRTPHATLPHLLRTVAALRRLGVSPPDTWAATYLHARAESRPRPPPDLTTPNTTAATATAMVWIDATRAHQFDTWAHARVAFARAPAVHAAAVAAAAAIDTDLRLVLTALPAPPDVAVVGRHARAALGAACRRLGFDLATASVARAVDAEMVRRAATLMDAAAAACVRSLARRALPPASSNDSEVQAVDQARPESWGDPCLAVFVARVIDALNNLCFPLVPVVAVRPLAAAIQSAVATVGQAVADTCRPDLERGWTSGAAVHIELAWNAIVAEAKLVVWENDGTTSPSWGASPSLIAPTRTR